MKFTAHHSSSAANLYTVKGNASSLMIEAGLRGAAIRAALNYQMSSIRAALISHSHLDHSRGCKDIMKAGIDCYMTAETANKLKLSGHRLQIVEPLKQFAIDEWTILPFPTQHDCPGSVGFLVECAGHKLVFITDSFYCRYKFKGLNIIAIECNWSKETLDPGLNPERKKRLYKSHFNLERVLQFLSANDLSKVREIHLLHLSDGNSDEALFKREVQKATGLPVYVSPK